MPCAVVVTTDSCGGQCAQVCIIRLHKVDDLVEHCSAAKLTEKLVCRRVCVYSSRIEVQHTAGTNAGNAR
jgi:hypothetical protein